MEIQWEERIALSSIRNIIKVKLSFGVEMFDDSTGIKHTTTIQIVATHTISSSLHG